MIKLYNGNGENLIQFSSTNREAILYDDELKELEVYYSDLEDKIEKQRCLIKRLQFENEELLKANHKLQRGLL